MTGLQAAWDEVSVTATTDRAWTTSIALKSYSAIARAIPSWGSNGLTNSGFGVIYRGEACDECPGNGGEREVTELFIEPSAKVLSGCRTVQEVGGMWGSASEYDTELEDWLQESGGKDGSLPLLGVWFEPDALSLLVLPAPLNK
jgi:hypothetical protein